MLRRHPLLLAEWLAVCNLLRRARAHAPVVVAASAGIIVALAVLLLTFAPRFRALFDGLLDYRVLTIAAVGLYAAIAVGRQRERAEVRYTQFWLAAAPVRTYSRTLAIVVVTLLPLAASGVSALSKKKAGFKPVLRGVLVAGVVAAMVALLTKKNKQQPEQGRDADKP